jgi:lysophospholipase L1-like esterase
MRFRWRPTLVVLVGGILLGGWLRPHAGELYRAWRRDESQPPSPLTPALWAVKAGQFELLDPLNSGARVVYLGDSLTDWMAVSELVSVEGGALLNRAITGDTSSGLLARVSRSFPAGVALCFLMIGRNDLRGGAAPAEIADRILGIARLLVERHGAQHVVVESILPFAGPRAADATALNDLVRERLAAAPAAISFLDLFPAFLRDGRRDEALYADDTHLNLRGIERRLRLELEHAARSAPAVSLRSRLPEHGAARAF